jgi:hypothetical protein
LERYIESPAEITTGLRVARQAAETDAKFAVQAEAVVDLDRRIGRAIETATQHGRSYARSSISSGRATC